MAPIIYIAMGFLFGVAFAKWRFDSQMRAHPAVKHKIINPAQMESRQENLEKILELLKQHDELTNDIVEKALGVSDATAERYLQELESQGKLTQVGQRGKYVIYKAV